MLEDEGEKIDAFAASNVALAASGTVALELAMAGVPTVIAYRMNPMTAWLARRLIRIRFVNPVNIVLDREAVPELLQENCRPDRFAYAGGYPVEKETGGRQQNVAVHSRRRHLRVDVDHQIELRPQVFEGDLRCRPTA